MEGEGGIQGGGRREGERQVKGEKSRRAFGKEIRDVRGELVDRGGYFRGERDRVKVVTRGARVRWR